MPVVRDGRHVVVRAGGERFALPIEWVREVVVPRAPFARVPHAAAAVRGVMNLRGRALALVELAPLVGLAADPGSIETGQVVALDGAGRGLGLVVESVLGVEALGSDGPPGGEAGPGRPVTVLDPAELESRAEALFQGRS